MFSTIEIKKIDLNLHNWSLYLSYDRSTFFSFVINSLLTPPDNEFTLKVEKFFKN